jgi:hypothetical protein
MRKDGIILDVVNFVVILLRLWFILPIMGLA